MMSVDTLLSRLERVRQVGPGRWITVCPSHSDRSPSLSIRELPDGRVLLHDFAGCGAIDVLDALGLEWSALFPATVPNVPNTYSQIPARDLLVILDHEIMVAVLILDDIVRQRRVNEEQVQRLIQAATRIGRARDVTNPANIVSRA